MAYDVSDHPLLETKGQQLYSKSPDAFEHQQAIAVQRLGLGPDTSYTAGQRLHLLRAITIQLNYQLDVPKTVIWMKQESSAQTKQNVTYRDGIPLVSPDAAAIVAETLTVEQVAATWGDITSVRRAVL